MWHNLSPQDKCDTCGVERYVHGDMYDHGFAEPVDVLGFLAKFAEDPYWMEHENGR
jgi:hypothetical protein